MFFFSKRVFLKYVVTNLENILSQRPISGEPLDAIRHLTVLNALELFSLYRYSLGRTCAFLNSVQKFIEMQGWLLLTFFICLHNELSSFNSIIVQMSEKRDSSNRQ